MRDTNWDDNTYHTEIWLADVKTGELRQLTSHAKKSSTSPAWSPDSSKLAFATDRDEKRQIYVIDPRGGEARKLTSAEEGVGGFAWAPDGKSIAFTSTDPKTDADKEREKKFGEFDVIGEGYRMSHLWVFDLAAAEVAAADERRLHRRLVRLVAGRHADRLRSPHQLRQHQRRRPRTSPSSPSPTASVRPLVDQDGRRRGPVWSPDGSKIAFESAMTKPFSFLNNAHRP